MSSRSSRTAVIADEHPLWLDALQTLLERLGFDVVGRAARRSDLFELLEQHEPDLLVVDLPPIADDAVDSDERYEALVRARDVNPEVRCIVLSEADDPAVLEGAFNAGATVFCVKRAEPEDLAAAIRQSFNNSIYFAPSRRFHTSAGDVPSVAEQDCALRLTKRELEILRLAADGHSNAQLARMLWVTEQTVKFHLSNMYRKLDVANRTEASRWAQRNGLLSIQSGA